MLNDPEQLLLPTRQATEAINNPGLVQAAFITLRNGLMGFSVHFPGQQDTMLDDFSTCARSGEYTRLGISVLKNGFVLQKVTKASSLVDHSHRLKVPTDGSPANYHRNTFIPNSNRILSRPININGEEAMSKNQEAVIQILSFERDVVYGALTNWENFGLIDIPAISC